MAFNLSTGNSQVSNDQWADNYIKETTAMAGLFWEDAMKIAAIYCMHAGRFMVLLKDTELALKTRAYHGDEFWNRNDTSQRLVEMKQLLSEPESESESESEEMEAESEEMEADDEENFIKSECTCVLCTTLNNIEEKWNTWNPTNSSGISIKKSIDDIFQN
jgi:hypothetical protein